MQSKVVAFGEYSARRMCAVRSAKSFEWIYGIDTITGNNEIIQARFQQMLEMLVTLFRDETGATAIEYGFVLVLISIAAISFFELMGDNLVLLYLMLDGELTDVVVASGQ